MEHPYSIEKLESMLRCVVAYEAEEGEYGLENLESMGIPAEAALFFGFPDPEE